MPSSRQSTNTTTNTTTDGGESSDAEISMLTTESSDSEASGGGFLGRLLRPSSNSSSSSKPPHNSRNGSNSKKQITPRNYKKNKPSLRRHDDDDDHRTEDDLQPTSPSWALSPSIGSIAEEEDSAVAMMDRGSPSRIVASLGCAGAAAHVTSLPTSPPTIHPSHIIMATTSTPTTTTVKEVISPPNLSVLTNSSPLNTTAASASNNGSMASPQSQTSLASLLETSSVANNSMASGYLSEATGIQSEATLPIRNTSGTVQPSSRAESSFPLPLSSSSQLHRHPNQEQVAHPHPIIRNNSSAAAAAAILEGDEEVDPIRSMLQNVKIGRKHRNTNNNKSSSRYPFCRGRTQGWIICVLMALFVAGVITVVVSFILSQRDNAGSSDADMLRDNNNGAGGLDDDANNGDLFNSSIFEDDIANNNDGNTGMNSSNNATLVDESGVLVTLAPTMMPSTAATISREIPPPTSEPSLNNNDESEESALFADAVEDLLDDKASPTLSPTVQPTTSAPTTMPQPQPTMAPTDNDIPQAISVSLTTTVLPTQSPMTPNPTQNPTTLMPTVAPTAPPPFLDPNTILEPEAQLLGANGGDAAGSSISLSGDGQVMVMGSPNASPNGSQRAGQVQVFERRLKATAKSFLRQSATTDANNTGEWEWSLRGSIPGVKANNQLGFTVATDDDGTIVVVSQPTADSRRGKVIIYEWQEVERAYVERQVLTGEQTTDHFGISLSLSGDGRRLAVGSPYHSGKSKPGDSASNLRGQVQVFEYSESTQRWENMKADDASLLLGAASLDWLGWAVSLSRDGQILAVGAPRNTEFGGYVQCFQYVSDTWNVMGSPILNVVPPVKLDDRFGHAVSITNTASRPGGSDSNVARVAIGSPWKDVGNVLNSGMVAIYEWTGSTWVLDDDGALGAVLTETQPGFYHQLGYTMQMAGDAIAVGAPGWDSRRGLVNLFWLTHAFSNDSEEGASWWERLSNPPTGGGPGHDFGFSVGLVTQTSQDGPNKPSSVAVAVGAIMVSDSNPEATGYSQVFRAGSSSV